MLTEKDMSVMNSVMNAIKDSAAVRILVNIIVGVLLFQIVFGLVFHGSAAGTFQYLVVLVVKLVKIIMILSVLTGSVLLFKKSLTPKGEDEPMNFNKEQVIKGIIIGILALIAFSLLSNLFGGAGGFTRPGYYGHGGGEGIYVNPWGGSLTGLLSSIMSLLINLMSIALVVFLALGVYKAAEPYLKDELGGLFKTSPKRKCEKCGQELSGEWKICPICGTSTLQPDPLPEPVTDGPTETASALEQEPVRENLEVTSFTVEQETVPNAPAESSPSADSPSADSSSANKPANKPITQKYDKHRKK